MRYVLVGIGVIIAIVAFISIIGWSLPVRHQARVERSFRATPTQLFELLRRRRRSQLGREHVPLA